MSFNLHHMGVNPRTKLTQLLNPVSTSQPRSRAIHASQRWKAAELYYRAPSVDSESEHIILLWHVTPPDSFRLRCDREMPCGNCVARDANCVFAPQARERLPNSRAQANHQAEARIRRLEQLVNSLVAQNQRPPEVNSQQQQKRQNHVTPASNSSSLEIESGQMISNSDTTGEVSGAHWTSICYEVK